MTVLKQHDVTPSKYHQSKVERIDGHTDITLQLQFDGYIFTFRQKSCGKVMFSVVIVCLLTVEGSFVTITHNVMALTLQTPQSRPPSRLGISLYRDPPNPGPLMDMALHCTANPASIFDMMAMFCGVFRFSQLKGRHILLFFLYHRHLFSNLIYSLIYC